MSHEFTYSQFLARFTSDEECLEEFKKLRYPDGIYCEKCSTKTKHYKVNGRSAYACKFCRTHIFPLSGTILEKTSTPMSTWFYAMFIMTHSRAGISAKQLQRETGVTYKTAWRMYKSIRILMEQNNGDLLIDSVNNNADLQKRVHRWTFFSKLEITVTQKQELSR